MRPRAAARRSAHAGINMSDEAVAACLIEAPGSPAPTEQPHANWRNPTHRMSCPPNTSPPANREGEGGREGIQTDPEEPCMGQARLEARGPIPSTFSHSTPGLTVIAALDPGDQQAPGTEPDRLQALQACFKDPEASPPRLTEARAPPVAVGEFTPILCPSISCSPICSLDRIIEQHGRPVGSPGPGGKAEAARQTSWPSCPSPFAGGSPGLQPGQGAED